MPGDRKHTGSAALFRVVAMMTAACAAAPLDAQINAYNPYADSQSHLPPVAPDGTLRWGTFYKSAAMQKAYERLWDLGACRNTNMAITVPVEMNKVAIDSLPEEDFRGVVLGVVGTIRGGMLAFTTAGPGAADAPPHVATLHPAGVSTLTVAGPMPATALRPGMTVRFHARIDRKGVAEEPLAALDVITPPANARPTAIEPDRADTIVGTVATLRPGLLVVRVDAGRIRRLSLSLAPDATVHVAAHQLDLVAPGDAVTVKGRVWRGEGCLGEGTVFASVVTVTKPERPATAAGPASPDRLGSR